MCLLLLSVLLQVSDAHHSQEARNMELLQNVQDKTSKPKNVSTTKRPTTQRPSLKMSQPQNIQATKRPSLKTSKPQNVPNTKCPKTQNVPGPKTSKL